MFFKVGSYLNILAKILKEVWALWQGKEYLEAKHLMLLSSGDLRTGQFRLAKTEASTHVPISW